MAYAKKSIQYNNLFRSRAVINLVILGMLFYILAAGISGFDSSFQAIKNANVMHVILGLGFLMLSFFAAALTYWLLAPKRVSLHQLVLVQISGGLVNRLLPAGLGGLGLNAYYFKRHGYSLPAATALVATNNMLGFFGNVVLVAVSMVFFSVGIISVRLPEIPFLVAGGILAAVLSGLVYAVIKHMRIVNISTFWHQSIRYVVLMGRRPWNFFGALLSSSCVTFLHACAMYSVILATATEASWAIALLATSVGAFIGASVPTPGGIGGAEAGIAAVLITFAVPAASAITIALIYRLLSYWLPLIPGYFAFRFIEKKYL